MVRNEMSTVLPLLDYQDISNKLQYFDNNKPGARITHVAVLNYILYKYPRGALCLLLRRRPELDACLRLHAFPALLPHLGDLVSRLQQTKLLICPSSDKPENTNCIDNIFSFESNLFRVETWNATGCISQSIPSAQARQSSGFKIQTRKSKNSKRPVQMSCRITSSKDPKLMLSIQVIRMEEIWSIKAIFELKQGSRERKLRTLFLSSIPADRCSVQLPDGRGLLVELRRLPGSARVHQDDGVSKICYQILVGLINR